VTTSPESAARETRRELGIGDLGPVPDVLQRVESAAAVNVVVARLPEGGPAGAYVKERGVPFILVNGREPVVRQRFTLAHELGHHTLGHGDVLDATIGWSATDPKEVAANRFAAEFLMPVAGVDAWVEARDVESLGLEQLVRLANAFGVSCETALWRAKAARRIAPAAADKLKARLDAHEHHGLRAQLGLSEMVDSLSVLRGRAVRVPQRMTGNVLRALEFGLIDEERAAQRLRLTVPALRDEIERQAADCDEE
jgi:Zn-dependent peptidase ImmA (M78 family)